MFANLKFIGSNLCFNCENFTALFLVQKLAKNDLSNLPIEKYYEYQKKSLSLRQTISLERR